MKDLFKSESHSIKVFKPGDIIYRNEPMVHSIPFFNENLGIEVVKNSYNMSYMYEPLKFLFIANDVIYLERLNKRQISSYGKNVKIPIEQGFEGWCEFKTHEGMSMDDLINF